MFLFFQTEQVNTVKNGKERVCGNVPRSLLFGIHALNNSVTCLETKQYGDSVGKCFSTA